MQPIISTCICFVCGVKLELDLQDVQVTKFFCPQTGHLNPERCVAVDSARDDVIWSTGHPVSYEHPLLGLRSLKNPLLRIWRHFKEFSGP